MIKNPLQKLIGYKIESARYDESSDSWSIKFAGGDILNIECMWRLLEEGVITSTNFDHAQKFGLETPFNGERALNEMSAHEILAVECSAETGDINITLGQYFTLQVVSTSAGYESWQFKNVAGQSIIAVGGQLNYC